MDAAGMFTKPRAVEALILILIIAAATWLRLYRLGEWSFWFDEALTVSDSFYLFSALPLSEAIHGRPLNFWITNWVFSLLPVSEWSARLVPCLAGIVTVPLSYFLTRDFLGSRAALLSSAFLALSTWHIYWSQNARGYALLLLLSLISVCLFYQGLEKRSTIRMAASLVAIGAAYLAHQVALLLGVAFAVYVFVLMLREREARQWSRSALLWIFALPLGIVLLIALPGMSALANHVLKTSQGGGPFYVLASLSYQVHPVFVVLGLSGVVFLVFTRPRLGLFLATAIGVPLLSLVVLSAIRGAGATYVFHTLPLYYMGAAVVLTEVTSSATGKAKALTVAIISAIISLQAATAFEYFTYEHGDRPRWREAAKFVSSVAAPVDVITTPHATVVDYYLTLSTSSRPQDARRPGRAVWLDKNQLDQLGRRKERTWVILTSETAGQDWEIREKVEDHCAIARIFDAWTSAKNRSVVVYRCDP